MFPPAAVALPGAWPAGGITGLPPEGVVTFRTAPAVGLVDGVFGDNEKLLFSMFGSNIKPKTRMNAAKDIVKRLLIAKW
jgi:hypothetical protein